MGLKTKRKILDKDQMSHIQTTLDNLIHINSLAKHYINMFKQTGWAKPDDSAD